jgi:hypothetical protein
MVRCLIENVTRRDSTAGAEMRRRIKVTTRRELTSAISQRYKCADRRSKKLILDEFTKVTGYHRKHAIRILTTRPAPPRERLAVPLIYREAVKESLIVLWEAADLICGERLKALLPQLVEATERHKHIQLEPEVRAQLLTMSAAAIDRELCSVREHAYGGRKKRTTLNRCNMRSSTPTVVTTILRIPLISYLAHPKDRRIFTQRKVGSFGYPLLLSIWCRPLQSGRAFEALERLRCRFGVSEGESNEYISQDCAG